MVVITVSFVSTPVYTTGEKRKYQINPSLPCEPDMPGFEVSEMCNGEFVFWRTRFS